MSPVAPGDIARKAVESRARQHFGVYAPAVEDVARIHQHFMGQLRVTEQTAATLTIAVVLSIHPEEDL